MIQEIDGLENERVDDIPLLLAVIKQTGLIDIFDQHIELHGNWIGLTMGQIIAVWLVYILSTGDHRKNQLQDWVAARKHTLLHSLGADELDELDFTDDRLGIILEKLSDDEVWQKSERDINKRIIKVYDLNAEIARIDTTTASSYGQVTEGGLLQFGHSKDHRPDLGQVKIASLTLDPLGLPLVTIPVSGEQADDGLYLLVVAEARESLGSTRGLLYVGDAKMAALGIRGNLEQHGERYLMPLPATQVKRETMSQYLDYFEALPEEERIKEKVMSEDGQSQLIAEGFTINVTQQLDDETAWTERRFIVHSPIYGEAERQRLQNRIEKSEQELERLVKRRQGYRCPQTAAELNEKIDKILTKNRCQKFLHVEVITETTQKKIRSYKGQSARVELKHNFKLAITRQEDHIAQEQRLLGWRAYATNAPDDQLSLTKAVNVYRDAYLHEHGYSRLKGKPLALTPMYLQKDTQITGLIRLLSLALRILTLIEFVVRKQLAKEACSLAGIYAGNPRRKTKTPRAETLLETFKGITLTIIQTGEKKWVHLSPLRDTQKRILQLLGLPETVYTCLVPQSAKVILKSAN